MTKRDLQILERIFSAEIDGRLPFQSNSKNMQRLADEGYIEPMTRRLGIDRFGAIDVSGWTLTHLGRMTYCNSCKDEELI